MYLQSEDSLDGKVREIILALRENFRGERCAGNVK